jgi:hypothetical protein
MQVGRNVGGMVPAPHQTRQRRRATPCAPVTAMVRRSATTHDGEVDVALDRFDIWQGSGCGARPVRYLAGTEARTVAVPHAYPKALHTCERMLPSPTRLVCFRRLPHLNSANSYGEELPSPDAGLRRTSIVLARARPRLPSGPRRCPQSCRRPLDKGKAFIAAPPSVRNARKETSAMWAAARADRVAPGAEGDVRATGRPGAVVADRSLPQHASSHDRTSAGAALQRVRMLSARLLERCEGRVWASSALPRGGQVRRACLPAW